MAALLRRLVLNDALPHGLYAVRGDSAAFWIVDWAGDTRRIRALRIRGAGGNVGYDDNKWLWLHDIAGRNPDDNDDFRHWEIQTGWRHRYSLAGESMWYDQTRCVSIELVPAGQVEDWLAAAKAVHGRSISAQMDPVEQLSPAMRALLGIDQPRDEPAPTVDVTDPGLDQNDF